MGQKIDLTNQRYGRLVALNPTDKRSKSGSIYWLFQCDCGKQKVIDSNQVRMGLVKSCGCLHAPHHGSKTSSSSGFLTCVSPKLAIISVGKNNRYYNKL